MELHIGNSISEVEVVRSIGSNCLGQDDVRCAASTNPPTLIRKLVRVPVPLLSEASHRIWCSGIAQPRPPSPASRRADLHAPFEPLFIDPSRHMLRPEQRLNMCEQVSADSLVTVAAKPSTLSTPVRRTRSNRFCLKSGRKKFSVNDSLHYRSWWAAHWLPCACDRVGKPRRTMRGR
ncbi:hypothetical protein J6590_052931 [Homalodisca vitripennis]|nr:hypothetical protein J6590_052931 [Homalodisca vitripennis]